MPVKQLLPKEHGAWAVLFVPLLVGLGVSRSPNWEGLLLILAALAFFIARQPVLTYFRERRFPKEARTQSASALIWAFLFVVLGVLAVLPLVLEGRHLLIPFGVAFSHWFMFHVILVLRRKERSLSGELLGVLGLTLTAPLAYYVSTGSLGREAWLLYALCALYFSAGIFLVKMKVRAHLAKQPIEGFSSRLAHGRATILYHLFMLASIGILIAAGLVPAVVLLAFLPSAIQAGVEIFRLSPELHLKRTGFTLLGHSVLFGLLLTLALS